MVCGARASHSVAGVHTALIAAAPAANTTSEHDCDREAAPHVPALQSIYRGSEQQREEQRHGHGNEDVLREVEQRSHRQHRQQDDRFAQRGIGKGGGCAHRANVRHLLTRRQAQKPLPGAEFAGWT